MAPGIECPEAPYVALWVATRIATLTAIVLTYVNDEFRICGFREGVMCVGVCDEEIAHRVFRPPTWSGCTINRSKAELFMGARIMMAFPMISWA